MHILKVSMALSALSSMATSILLPRVMNDPETNYLDKMCLPNWSNNTRLQDLGLKFEDHDSSLVFSPFPCEQVQYLVSTCWANGTSEIDFLAEQQCLCGGNFFDAFYGCDLCYLAHGANDTVTVEEEKAWHSSHSVAECAPTPPFQPYSNLLQTANRTSQSLAPLRTLGVDKFPNMTAVSNYWTGTGLATRGSITGSATARVTSYTYNSVPFVPTTTPLNSGTGNATVSHAATVTSSTSTNGTTSSSAAAGATNGVGVIGGVLAAGMGVIAMM